MRRVFKIAAFASFALQLGSALAQTPAATLPGGASSLQETYQDWQVSCGMVQNDKVCSMSQVQTQQNGQRILAIELRAGKDGGVGGVLVLPFGLRLDDGASLKIDSNPALPVLRFSTCLPAGCLLPLTFASTAITSLKSGTALTVTARPVDGAQPFTLPISLKGFGTAFDRLNQLQKS